MFVDVTTSSRCKKCRTEEPETCKEVSALESFTTKMFDTDSPLLAVVVCLNSMVVKNFIYTFEGTFEFTLLNLDSRPL